MSLRRDQFASGRRGFTLIELLVVIATIAILAALLLPTLSRAKARADGVACRSNLHQLGLGLQMYLEDFHAYPPQWAYHTAADVNSEHIWMDPIGNWHVQLEPYVRAQWPNSALVPAGAQPKGLFVCPGSLRMGRLPYTGTYAFNQSGLSVDIPPAPWGVALDLGLGLGGKVLHVGSATIGYSHTSEKAVIAPADMMAAGDSAAERPPRTNPTRGWDVILWGGDFSTLADGYHANGGSVIDSPLYQRRHGARFNVLFCDSHVESLRLAQFWNHDRADIMTRWNTDHQPHPQLPP